VLDDDRIECTGVTPCPVPADAKAVVVGARVVVAESGHGLRLLTRSSSFPLPPHVNAVRVLGAASDRGLACLVGSANEVWCLTEHEALAEAQLAAQCQAGHGLGSQGMFTGVFSVADARHTWCRQRTHSQVVSAIAGDVDFGCLAAGTTTTVRCWSSQPGPVDTERAYPLADATALVVGDGHVCALDQTKAVRCWGDDDKGELGVVGSQMGDPEMPIFGLRMPLEKALKLPGLAKRLFTNDEMSCALLENNTSYCWGDTDQLPLLGLKPGSWHARMHRGEAKFAKQPGASTIAALPLWVPDQCDPASVFVDATQVCAVCGETCVRCWNAETIEGLGACQVF
jgi:hypothetical protein